MVEILMGNIHTVDLKESNYFAYNESGSFEEILPYGTSSNYLAEYVNSCTKRIFDISVGSIILIILVPLIFVIASIVKMSSPGPVFFVQTRRGNAGQPFRIFKFRTMRSEMALTGYQQAVVGDHRITKVGAFLRRTSLDELPQLFNVVRGEMSLVGPRPHPVELDDAHSDVITDYNARFRGRPGMTGLAQISGSRGPTPDIESMRQRVAYDLSYLSSASMLVDFRILLLTIREVFVSQRAF